MCALLAAVSMGVLLMLVCTALPGFGRTRRGMWALRRVSRWVLHGMGIRVEVTGKPRSGPGLVVGNHTSFLDILVLASCGSMRMVAKQEVGSWPVVGPAARRVGTLFLQRERLRELPDAVAGICSVLRSGYRVQVFPEATTRCGSALDPFRRAAFQAAIDAAVVVMPVSLAYRDAQGLPTTVPAFVGDEDLMSCVRRVVAMRGLNVQVHWLPAIPAIAGTGKAAVDRRMVARLAQNAVARDLGLPVMRRTRGRPGTSALVEPSAPGLDKANVAAA